MTDLAMELLVRNEIIGLNDIIKAKHKRIGTLTKLISSKAKEIENLKEAKEKPKMSCKVTIKDNKGKYHHFEVPRPVKDYIRQLETYINHPEESKLKEVYADRFGE